MKRFMLFLLCALLLMLPPLTAYAADKKDDGVSITVIIPQTTKPPPAPAATPTKNYLYPVSVWESQENGRREIIRTYELGASEKPEDIPRESFVREGWLYELADITRKETANASVRNHTEKVSIDTATNDMASILNLLAPTTEYTADDGYIGMLQLDIASIKVETAGTRSSSYTVNATREYPNLSSNDTSVIPKTITDSGRTLTLAGIDWKNNNISVDSVQIPDSYTAVATYTGTASKTVVTGYVTKAEYKGQISKILTGKTVYTAYFIGVQIISPTITKPSENSTEPPTEAPIEPPETAEPQTEEFTVIEQPATEEAEPPVNAETEIMPTTPTEAEDEPEKNGLSFMLVIIVALLVVGIGGIVVLFLLKHNKKMEEYIHEDE